MASAWGAKAIVDLLRTYLEWIDLKAEMLSRGFVWPDADTTESLLEAGPMVWAIEQRQGLRKACLEDIAWRADWSPDDQFLSRMFLHGKTACAQYLLMHWV